MYMCYLPYMQAPYSIIQAFVHVSILIDLSLSIFQDQKMSTIIIYCNNVCQQENVLVTIYILPQNHNVRWLYGKYKFNDVKYFGEMGSK